MTYNELLKRIQKMTPVERRQRVRYCEPYGLLPPRALDALWQANAKAAKQQCGVREGNYYLAM